MKRRDFIALIGSAAAAWPLAARAQHDAPVRRVGFLLSAIPAAQFGLGDLGGFTQGMRELGYLEGKDFVIEWRSAEGQYERLPDLAAELVQMESRCHCSGVNTGRALQEKFFELADVRSCINVSGL